MVLVGSGVFVEQEVPPQPKMEDVRRELDSAVLQAKQHCLRKAREQKDAENEPVKRYMYAVTVMRNDRFFSLHSGRRSRSLTRVYVEERAERSRSAIPALPKKNGFVEEENDDGSLRLEWHETIEGRKADVTEDDAVAVEELRTKLPLDYREWEHEVSIELQEPTPNTTATVYRIGDHLFSYEEPFDLSVKLPDQVHYFFTGEHLPEKRRLYSSLPNLSAADLLESSAFNHSAHSFYGHGFRQVGTTFLSRTMESLHDDRINIGTRPTLHEMRGEPALPRYFPMRSQLLPSHSQPIRPPLSVSSEERGHTPVFHSVELDRIGSSWDRLISERYREPMPTGRQLGKDFDRNLSNFWQLNPGSSQTFVSSSQQAFSRKRPEIADSGISMSSGMSVSVEPKERIETEVADKHLLIEARQGGMDVSREVRKSHLLSKEAKFGRKYTSYYDENFVSSVEEVMEEGTLSKGYPFLSGTTAHAEDSLTQQNFKESAFRQKEMPLPTYSTHREDPRGIGKKEPPSYSSYFEWKQSAREPTVAAVERHSKHFEQSEQRELQEKTECEKSKEETFASLGRAFDEESKTDLQKDYTLVSSSGRKPRKTEEQHLARRRSPDKKPPRIQEEYHRTAVKRHEEDLDWNVEGKPPDRVYIASPESDEVAKINLPIFEDFSVPKSKKIKVITTTEVKTKEIKESWMKKELFFKGEEDRRRETDSKSQATSPFDLSSFKSDRLTISEEKEPRTPPSTPRMGHHEIRPVFDFPKLKKIGEQRHVLYESEAEEQKAESRNEPAMEKKTKQQEILQYETAFQPIPIHREPEKRETSSYYRYDEPKPPAERFVEEKRTDSGIADFDEEETNSKAGMKAKSTEFISERLNLSSELESTAIPKKRTDIPSYVIGRKSTGERELLKEVERLMKEEEKNATDEARGTAETTSKEPLGPERRQRESQTLNMLIGFGEFEEPRKMRWDSRGYPAHEVARETHGTLSRNELPKEELPLWDRTIPPYPERKGIEEREFIEGLEIPYEVKHKQKRRAPEPPKEDEYAKILPKAERIRRKELWDKNGYPVKTDRMKAMETLEYSEFNGNSGASEKRKKHPAPPIPAHFKKPPPPYEVVLPRSAKPAEQIRGILKNSPTPDDMATGSQQLRKTLKPNEVEEIGDRLKSSVRLTEPASDWVIAEEIVDESLKSSICPSEKELRNPSIMTIKSFDMEEPSLGGRKSDTEEEIVAEPERDYAKQQQKGKGILGLFKKKKMEISQEEQFIEEIGQAIEPQDRPDLYVERPHSSHGFLHGVREKLRNKEHEEERRKRSQSHDGSNFKRVEFLEEVPQRKRSSSVQEAIAGTRKNLKKAKDFVAEKVHFGRIRDSLDVQREEEEEQGTPSSGIEGHSEVAVDVPPMTGWKRHEEPRFGFYKKRKNSREVTASTSENDPDNIKNILEGVIREKNDVVERFDSDRHSHQESTYTSASTIEIGQGAKETFYAVPATIYTEPVYPTSTDAKIHQETTTQKETQSTSESSHFYNAFQTQESTVSADLYADPPSPEEEKASESMIVEPPSPELQRSAEKFATEFTAKLAKVEDVLREAEVLVKREETKKENIYDSVYEERIYDEVASDNLAASVPPPVPSSPIPRPREELHYAAVAIATDDRYKDDEHIYEEIGEPHVVESTPYAEPVVEREHQHIENCPYPLYETPIVRHEKEVEYAEVPREDIVTKVVHKVEHSIAHLKEKFESKTEEHSYGRIEAPKRKDYAYDENSNATYEDQHVLSRTPEIESTRAIYRDVKPYVGSPTFNKLQKKFFPEDLAERQALRDREEVDLSVLKSPTTVVTNNGVTETEYRAYDKNQYEEEATLVMKTPVDAATARTTMAIRRMSRNNQWSEDELETEKARLATPYSDYSVPSSPAPAKVLTPLASPRSVYPRYDRSPSPRPESPKIATAPPPVRPTELVIDTRNSVVERVVSSEAKPPHSPEILYQTGFVKEKRKLFENDSVPNQPSYSSSSVKWRSSTASSAAARATVVKSEVHSAAKVHEPASSPAEVQLKRATVIGTGAAPATVATPTTPSKTEEGGQRRSVLEMRRAYEASVQSTQSSSTTSSPQRSRANTRRRTGEVEIGSGAALTKYSEEQSSAARRTIHRTLDKHIHESVTIPIGQGAQVSIERREESPVIATARTTIGHGVAVERSIESSSSLQKPSSISVGRGVSISTVETSPSPVPVGRGAIPVSAPPPVPQQNTQAPAPVAVEVPSEVIAKPIQEVRESTTAVEEEPTPLQRNGSGRRSWTVKTYENNIRFDNQKLKMPDVDFATANGHITNGFEKMNGEENAVLKDWDPRPLVRALYEVSYEPRMETKRNRFFNMEGHVEIPCDETNTLEELEREWKQQYMRTKEGRLQIFVSHCAEEAPAEEIVLSGCDVDANRENRTLTIHGGREHIKMLLRVPSVVFDKWRQALLSHAASSQIDAYVKPVVRTMEHLTERVIIIEIGSCSIRGGRLTQETSLPQSFFPAIGVKTDDGRIIVGEDAFAPQVRHRGEFIRPIQATDPAVERYTMDKDVVKACMNKVVSDLQVDPSKYKVLLSIPQNIPIVLISELVTIALQDIKFQGAAITRQPSLILYAYDVTTGVVVDIGDRLNIVPVIDGYVVDSAICSIPYGATQVREALRSDLCAHNKGLYSFQSPIEKLILRYVMEQACYVPENYPNEEKSGVKDVMVTLEPFNPTSGMQTKFNIDSSRFTCTEGLFRPKKWGLDTKGLHQLIHEAVQMSPIDSRRTLYRNIYLAGGASLLPGLAEKLEQELAEIVPSTIHTQVHISPWRYNAAYLGAQVVASSATFEDKCVTTENLQKFLFNLSTSTF